MRTRRAHAKLNLFLQVESALPAGDPHAGLHPILSWMCPIDLSDDIVFEVLETGEASRLSIEWAPDAPRPSPIDWSLDHDLVFRAHRALEEHVGHALPMRIGVHKRIPVGSGLGGGSSDAALALTTINEVCGLGLGLDELRAVGHGLGSDVPFFLDEVLPPRSAIVSHLGECIERLDTAPDERILLIFPPISCSTGAVYRAFDAQAPASAHIDETQLRHIAMSGTLNLDALRNDLLEPACVVEPRLREVVDRCSSILEDGKICMSGSGSTLWCLDTPEARSGLETVADAMDLIVYPTRLGAAQRRSL